MQTTSDNFGNMRSFELSVIKWEPADCGGVGVAGGVAGRHMCSLLPHHHLPSSLAATQFLLLAFLYQSHGKVVSSWNSSNLKHKLTECKRSNSILVSKWSSLECPIIWKPLVICWRNTMLGFYHLTIWNWLHLPTDKSPSSCWLLPFFPPWDFHKFVDNNTPVQTCGAVKDNKEGGRGGSGV